MAVLIDTSFLIAVMIPTDRQHKIARKAMQKLQATRVIAAPVLTELFYVLAGRVNYFTAVRAFNTIQTGAFQVEALGRVDMIRMHEIMMQYADNEFDFTDTAIMALAERLNITEIYTFDRRDFSVFRPGHSDYLDLMP